MTSPQKYTCAAALTAFRATLRALRIGNTRRRHAWVIHRAGARPSRAMALAVQGAVVIAGKGRNSGGLGTGLIFQQYFRDRCEVSLEHLNADRWPNAAE